MSYSFSGAGTYGGTGSLSFGSSSFVTQESLMQSMNNDWAVEDAVTAHAVEKTSETSTIYAAIDKFENYLEDGHEDKAMKFYEELLDEMKKNNYYSSMDDSKLKSAAADLLQARISKNKGEDINLKDYIIKYAANAGERQWQAEVNIFDGAPRYDDTTEEDLLNAILGMDEEKSDHEQSGVVNVLAHIPGFFVSIVNIIAGPRHF